MPFLTKVYTALLLCDRIFWAEVNNHLLTPYREPMIDQSTDTIKVQTMGIIGIIYRNRNYKRYLYH